MHEAVYKGFKVYHISNGFYAKAFGKLITNVWGGGLLGAWHVAVIPALRRQRKEDGKVGDSEASLGCHKQTSSSSKTVRKVFSRALHLTIS